MGHNNKHEAGRKIYNFRCYFCHGYSGDANTLATTFLDPKPRNFRATALGKLSRKKMVQAVTLGIKGTAMQSFKSKLSQMEIEAVVDFVRNEFMRDKAENTRYHTKANGWANHEQYRDAFGFATGELALDTPDYKLSEAQIRGRRLFMQSCITCHDRGKVKDEGLLWRPYAVSYPRNQFSFRDAEEDKPDSAGKHEKPDAVSGATVFAKHDKPPVITGLNNQEKQGEKLFQTNCAFCHAADGTGKNWIGSFLQPNPRDLTDKKFMSKMTPIRLKSVIQNGLKETTMPAWKSVLTETQIDSIIAYIKKAFAPMQLGKENGGN